MLFLVGRLRELDKKLLYNRIETMRIKSLLVALLMAATALVAVSCEKDKVEEPSSQEEPITGSAFGKQLKSLDIVSRVDTIVPVQNPAGYNELYRVTFKQLVDHNNPSAGTFEQKAFLFYVGDDRPTVLYTCGYILYEAYAQAPFVDLAYNMNANLLMVEHRYFGNSKPANDPRWDYLTIAQAAADHHAIIEALKPLLPKEWVSTGTSKDGMTSIFLRYFYPNDIDVTTAFCSPLMTSLHYKPVGLYMNNESGTAEERAQMRAIMNRMLQNGEQGLYARCLELLDEHNINDTAEDYSFTWYVRNLHEGFFYYFSYGDQGSPNHLPSLNATDDQLILTMLAAVFNPYDYSFVYPYEIQTAKELGQFDYDYEAYADVLEGTSFDASSLRSNPSDLHPEDRWLYSTYDSSLLVDIRNNFIPNTTCPILLVYQKNDPWTGARPDQVNQQYSKMIINPSGIHNHDINNPAHYSPGTRQEIMDFIAQYVPYGNDPAIAKRPVISISHKMKDQFMIRRW